MNSKSIHLKLRDLQFLDNDCSSCSKDVQVSASRYYIIHLIVLTYRQNIKNIYYKQKTDDIRKILTTNKRTLKNNI